MDLRALVQRLRNFVWGSGGSIGTKVVRSGVLVGTANAAMALIGVVRSILLARLLTPEIFGLMGLAGIAIRTIEAITRPGIAQALIAGSERFDKAASTAFTLLVLRGVFLSLILAGIAPIVAHFYEAPELKSMLLVLSVVFVVGGLSNINLVACQKDLDFRYIAVMDLCAWIIGAVVTIGSAWWFRSVWALVIGQIITAIATVLLSYIVIPGRPTFGWNTDVARGLMGYGKFVTGSSLLLFVAAELDSAVVGKVLGMEELGLYTLAFTIANLVTANLAKVAASVVMPAYSKLKGNVASLRGAYFRTLAFTMSIVLPATVGLLLVAKPLITVVYGEKWALAALPLQVLCVFGMMRSLVAFSGYLFEGIGQPRIAFRIALLRLAVIGPLIVPMTLQFGLLGSALAVTIAMAVSWVASVVFVRRHLEVGVKTILSPCWKPAWTSAIMGLGVWLVMTVVNPFTAPGLGAAIAVGVVIYAGLNWAAWKGGGIPVA